MSEDGFSAGLVSRNDIAELAGLFDRFEFAFDPRSLSAKEAESDFDDALRKLFDERVAPKFPNLSFVNFHGKVKSLCRAYLKKNAPP